MKFNFLMKEFQNAEYLRTHGVVFVDEGDTHLAEQGGLCVASPLPLEKRSSHQATSPFKYFLCSFWKRSASKMKEYNTVHISVCYYLCYVI